MAKAVKPEDQQTMVKDEIDVPIALSAFRDNVQQTVKRVQPFISTT